jgi:hypothetical protein
MPRLPRLALLVSLLLAGWTTAAAQSAGPLDPGPRVVNAAAPHVDALIAGQPVRLRFDLAAHAPVVLSPEAAARLGLAQNLRDGARARVRRGTLVTQAGRVQVKIPFSAETLLLDGRAHDVEVAVPPDFRVADADGLIGPKGLPCRAVRYELRPVGPADREIRFALEGGTAFAGLYTRVPAGPAVLRVEVAPSRPFTHATAASGAALAALVGGRLTGPLRDIDLSYGIRRPARLLKLDRPWTETGLPVGELLMRVQDWEGSDTRPPDADADPEDILVLVARDPQRAVRLLTLGADVVGGCASFEWRRDENLLLLRCP